MGALITLGDALTTCILAELATAGAQAPERVIPFNPGEIADDKCDCGLLAITATRLYYSNTGQGEQFNPPANSPKCGAAYRVYDMSARLMRCAPGSGPQGAPPTVEAIAESAVIWERDLDAVRKALGCCLQQRERANLLAGFALGAQSPAGPAGLCVGSVSRFLVWFNTCICGPNG